MIQSKISEEVPFVAEEKNSPRLMTLDDISGEFVFLAVEFDDERDVVTGIVLFDQEGICEVGEKVEYEMIDVSNWYGTITLTESRVSRKGADDD